MSSSYVVEPQDSGTEKKDDTLIIVVNDDGTISVDHGTLQSLIMNQSNANVSVVRVGQVDTDAENGDITLTVDPPPFVPAAANPVSGSTDAAGLVDPFMQMDPEQLERLETALQSEEAKQILGENVTAMLDMLTVEEQQNSIRYSVELDHCYTSRLSPSDPKPRDPLPVTDTSNPGDGSSYTRKPSPSHAVSLLSLGTGDIENLQGTKSKPVIKSIITKTVGRPRKSLPSTSVSMSGNIRSNMNIVGTPKSSGHPVPRSVTSAMHQGVSKAQGRLLEEDDDEDTFTSTESSESEESSDNDSDFGPRGPRRGVGVRARGGRKGLTTRGGSMATTRRRGPNKHMDMEQVRRLDMEMAAAVNAMKSPEKDDKSSGFSPVKGRRQIKTPVGRKKEESPRVESTSNMNEDVTVTFEKPLQTTNQVKANLINANMIKGDMILTKPGQGRSNQKVTFVQKQVLMKPNDLKNIALKKQVMVPKGKILTQGGTKFFATKDGKLVQVPVTTKTVSSNLPVIQVKSILPQSPSQPPPLIQNQTIQLQQQIQPTQQQQPQQPAPQQPQQPPSQQQQPQQQPLQLPQAAKVVSPTTPKIKLCEVKKEKRKSDAGLDLHIKTEVDPGKTPEAKITDGSKKHQKKEHRKSPGYVVDTLGPALFSTPDIIRRVGSNGDSKAPEGSLMSPIPTAPSTSSACTGSVGSPNLSIQSSPPPLLPTLTPTLPKQQQLPSRSTSCSADGIASIPCEDTVNTLNTEDNVNTDMEECASTSIILKETISSTAVQRIIHTDLPVGMEDSETGSSSIQEIENEPKPSAKVSLQEEMQPSLDSGTIEGEEHLLATLEMEASKHEEELLAEALLLQEELGVDLADHPALVEERIGVTTDTLTSNNMLIPALITSEQDETKLSNTVNAQPALTTSATTTEIPVATATTPPTSIVATTLSAATASLMTVAREPVKKSTKDEKEPIQIVRGGRVITLPPIEAPATRSKRLQAKAEPAQKTPEPTKRPEKFNVQTIQQAQKIQPIKNEIRPVMEEEEDPDEDDDDEEEDNSDSEDDPDRLWCICKRPHNNRFMICCDVCEDWFHGKCVHVSKAMGQQMEEKGIEWVCPNCAKKKSEEAKAKVNVQGSSGKQRIQLDLVMENAIVQKTLVSQRQIVSPIEETSPSVIPSGSDQVGVQYSGSMQCVVCKKEARNSSIYCSDACILAHAQETLTKDKPLPGPAMNPKIAKPTPLEVTAKLKAEARVIVFERKTGRVLTGAEAPTRSNLRIWLKENPTFEVVSANNLSSLQIGKAVTSADGQVHGKTGKTTLLSPPGKTTTLQKMVYTKVPGSKQMILTSGNKKFTVISGIQHQQQHLTQPSNTKTIQLKQTLLTHTGKSPLILKTTTTKAGIQIQPKQQGAGSPKQMANNKKPEIKPPVIQPKQQMKPTPPKKPEPEPIRLNIRKTLTELLSSRIKETEDLKLSDEEIADLAFNIELELYKYFKDTGAKYKAKYRSLVFNIKDTKNLTLFRKIADKSLTPYAVVRLSPDDMASQELAEWREKETKHQLEMIKKNELDLMAQAKSIVVKTHKGEQIIENDGGIDHVDPKTPVQDIVTALNSGDSISSTVDDAEKERDRVPDEERMRTKGESRKFKNLDTKKKKDKDRERDKDKEKDRGREKEPGRSRGSSRRDRSTSRNRHRHSRDDRDHSKTREKSRERKSIRSKESRREKEKERERERERERNKDRDRSKVRERGGKEKIRQKERERERHKGGENNLKGRNGESKDLDKRDDERKRDSDKKEDQAGTSAEKPIEDRLWRHIEDEATTNTIDGNDSDVSDREPTSTVTIKTPDINDDVEKERDHEQPVIDREPVKGVRQTVWRGFVNMVDVAKFFITAQEVSGHARDLMDDLPDTVDVVGRISHETVWDYISKMKKTGSKEILVIRLTAANDEEKIPYITLYSYLNSRSRLGVVGTVSKNIKDFYIMPFSSQSTIPQVLLPLIGPGFEEHRPHLLLGIIVRNKRKRLTGSMTSSAVPAKLSKKDSDRSYTPPLISKDKMNLSSTSAATPTPPNVSLLTTAGASSPTVPALASVTPLSSLYKTGISGSIDSVKDKQHSVSQVTLDSLNKAHIGMSRSGMLDTATICKIVPELSSKIDLTSSPGKGTLDDDGDEPYSPGELDEEDIDLNIRTSTPTPMSMTTGIDGTSGIISSSKNSTDLQRKMEELNRQIEEQKQQIKSISSSFLGESTSTLPGLGLDPPVDDCDEAYSPTDSRSFTPPPPGISKFSQPILEKVSNITIPANLQEILANVKRQESSKVDPYLPSKPSATFLTTVNSSSYQHSEKYSSSLAKLTGASSSASCGSDGSSGSSKSSSDKSSASEMSQQRETPKETKSTLSSLSDLDLIKKAEEELAAVAAASAAASIASSPIIPVVPIVSETPNTSTLSTSSVLATIGALPPSPIASIQTAVLPGLPPVAGSSTDSLLEVSSSYKTTFTDSFKRNFASEQPKPPGLEDEDFPPFPSTPPSMDTSPGTKSMSSRSKFVPKSGIVLSVKRKNNEDGGLSSPCKVPRTKSRWGQGPSDSLD